MVTGSGLFFERNHQEKFSNLRMYNSRSERDYEKVKSIKLRKLGTDVGLGRTDVCFQSIDVKVVVNIL
jgi:hypothetical protein